MATDHDGSGTHWRPVLTRDDYIKHILMMLEHGQKDFARDALIQYDKWMPWLALKQGVREALGAI